MSKEPLHLEILRMLAERNLYISEALGVLKQAEEELTHVTRLKLEPSEFDVLPKFSAVMAPDEPKAAEKKVQDPGEAILHKLIDIANEFGMTFAELTNLTEDALKQLARRVQVPPKSFLLGEDDATIFRARKLPQG